MVRVGSGFEDNVLLRAFHRALQTGGAGSRTSDRFAEDSRVGSGPIADDRLAQVVGSAPDKLRGGEGARISNQRPIAEKRLGNFQKTSAVLSAPTPTLFLATPLWKCWNRVWQ